MDATEKLKRELDHLYKKYHRAELLDEDPLGLVGGHLSAGDFELTSYISAALSYGRVEQIRKSLQELWIRLGKVGLRADNAAIRSYFVDNSWKSVEKDLKIALKGWVYRFNNERDLLSLFKVLHISTREHPSLGDLYAQTKTDHPTEKLEAFIQQLRTYAGKDLDLFGWFACAPSEGSTCKRMVMWLRWMLRADEIDPGTWSKNPALQKQGVGAHLAFIPMDTHVHKWAMQRQILSTKNPTWKSVEELSAVLRKVDPTDPARFDFCICHYGMEQFRIKSRRTLS